MPVKRVSPEEAQELLRSQGYVYVDVRSVPEFEAGHPEGAYNVPLLHMGRQGMSPNRDFLDVMQRRFAKDAKLVLGCRSGGRSLQAAQLLASTGFTDVVDQRAGFEGGMGPAGFEPGWAPKGLPTATGAPQARSYDALSKKDDAT
jgi:rhodanese-related sulfurtransferase